ncbi:hypothetical protein ACIQU4_25590, partial [Streptomyces sp. NPDC090741]
VLAAAAPTLTEALRKHRCSTNRITDIAKTVLVVLAAAAPTLTEALRKHRCSTNRITDIAKTVLVLHHAST